MPSPWSRAVFLRPIEPLAEYLRERGRGLDVLPPIHPACGCSKSGPGTAATCAAATGAAPSTRWRSGLGANVIAFGHTAGRFLRGPAAQRDVHRRLTALPPVTRPRDRRFRLIRPGLRDRGHHHPVRRRTRRAPRTLSLFAANAHRTTLATRPLRRSRTAVSHLKENMLSAMGNLDAPPARPALSRQRPRSRSRAVPDCHGVGAPYGPCYAGVRCDFCCLPRWRRPAPAPPLPGGKCPRVYLPGGPYVSPRFRRVHPGAVLSQRILVRGDRLARSVVDPQSQDWRRARCCKSAMCQDPILAKAS